MVTWFEVRDPIYGFIQFNEWEKQIIDSPEFQRLRRIKQLGLTDMVYPGATHTRFEHSLGVMHLATKMYDMIVNSNKSKTLLETRLKYDDVGLKKDRQLVRLAALLHDIGQMPFSHMLEDGTYNHETYTSAIIKGPLRNKIENHALNKMNYNISADDIAALIEGDAKILGKRVFWKILISSQLDADRGDYLPRDSHHLGVKYGVYDLDRLLVTLGLGIDPENDEVVLGVREDGWHVAEALIIARYQMFCQVYFHKTRQAYDYMLHQAIKDTKIMIPKPTEIEEFLKLDDYTIWNLIINNSIKSYWCNAILRRNHLRSVYKTEEVPTEEDIKKIQEVEEKLKSNNIWYCIMDTGDSWYKLNHWGEVMIVDEGGKVSPLSKYSRVVRYLGETKQIRVYVKSEDKDSAENILGRISQD
ncbi:MAG: HD domain-containing protein [Thermoproteota archaeon]